MLDLGDVFSDLLDVRPGYPPTVPTTSADPWPAVVDEVAAALHDTISTAASTVPPAAVLSWALALRTVRATTHPPAGTSSDPTAGTTAARTAAPATETDVDR